MAGSSACVVCEMTVATDQPALQCDRCAVEGGLPPVPRPEDGFDVTYTLIEGGTQRGASKLVDSHGYSYTKKPRRNSRTTYWRCSVRPTGDGCPATVIERNGSYRRGNNGHTHPPVVNAATNLKVQAAVRARAVDNMSRSARSIVQEVVKTNVDVATPNPGLPSTAALVRMANRRRQDHRSKNNNEDPIPGVPVEDPIPGVPVEDPIIDVPVEDDIQPDDGRVVTYTRIEGGTQRGAAKLVDSLGYSYTVHRRNPRTTHWRCSVRPNGDGCTATVIERNGSYHRGSNKHIHPPEVNAATNLKVRAAVKVRAMEYTCRPAWFVVRKVVKTTVDAAAPNPGLPSTSALVRMVNRRRLDYRSKNPTNNNGES